MTLEWVWEIQDTVLVYFFLHFDSLNIYDIYIQPFDIVLEMMICVMCVCVYHKKRGFPRKSYGEKRQSYPCDEWSGHKMIGGMMNNRGLSRLFIICGYILVD